MTTQARFVYNSYDRDNFAFIVYCISFDERRPRFIEFEASNSVGFSGYGIAGWTPACWRLARLAGATAGRICSLLLLHETMHHAEAAERNCKQHYTRPSVRD
jgi:hypothetical protein